MTDILDDERREQTRREQAMRDRAIRHQFRKDVQEVFGTPAGRRLLHAFLTDANFDGTTLRDTAQAMGHAAGWQDAGRWWIQAIREHCPEREAQMRKEAQEAARRASQGESDDD